MATAPNGPILFNSSTGSDTAASGLGPDPAVSGTGADLDATSTVDLSADSPDLSGVTAGDLLWVQSSTGRQFSIVASVDNTAKTVTCDDAFGVTETGRTWAIGGKRQTLDSVTSRQLIETDGPSNVLTLEIEYTGVDYSLSSALNLENLRDVTVRGSGATRPTIECSHNGNCFNFRGKSVFKNLILQNTNPTKTSSTAFYGVSVSGVTGILRNITTGTSGNGFGKAIDSGSSASWNATDSGFAYCSADAITAKADCTLFRCRVAQNGGDGINGSGSGTVALDQCLLDGNTDHGLTFHTSAVPSIFVRGCVFHGNGQSGVNQTNSYGPTIWHVTGNLFASNGTYGVGASANLATEPERFLVKGNAFYSNSSGQVDNWDNQDAITLTANPFVDAANGDFNINNDPGGGALLRAETVVLP